MAQIKPYEKNGKKYYKIQGYLGIDLRTGKKRSISRNGFRTKKEAKLTFSKIRLEFEKDNLAPADKIENIKFKDVYEKWYPTYINTVRTSTYARTEAMFNNHILPEFGNQYIKTITIDQIQKAVNKWFKLAPLKNYKRWYQYTSTIFDFAIKRGYMNKLNPAKSITLPKLEKQPGTKKQNFWDKKQLNEFFNLIKDDEKQFNKYVLFRLLAYSGIRRGECLALTWKDIDFNKNTVTVNKTLTQGLKGKTIVQPPKTNAGYRTIPLDKTTMNILLKWKNQMIEYYFSYGKHMTNDQTIFPGRGNAKYKSLNTPEKWLNKIVEDNSLKKITIHGFRKSYCTALVSAEVPLKEVQRRMGHDDIRTTLDVYSFVTDEQIESSTKKFEKYMEM